MSEHDNPSKRYYNQIQNKTIGPPEASTGLVGDQQPESVFTRDNFDQVSNQIALQETNDRLLELVNKVGQATNMQSQSGPIPGTHKNVTVTDTSTSGNQLAILFSPDPGQVWQLVGAATGTVNATRVELALQDRATDTYVEIGAETSAATQFDPTGIVPVYITYDVPLYYFTVSQTGNTTINASVIRVR
jgi:hypothetical protein